MHTQWARFWAKVEVSASGCWLWNAGRFSNGYACFSLGGEPRRNALGHRFAYERLVGPIQEGLDLDHLCRVRHCVNPAHLEPVSRSVNLLRGAKRALRTKCKRGHRLSGSNVYLAADGKRHCVACRREQKARFREQAAKDPVRLAELREADARYHREARTRARGGEPASPNDAKTHCPAGHPYSGQNLYVTPDGSRKCRACIAEANRRAYLKRTSQA